MKPVNPFVQEGFRAAFGRRAFRRAYMAQVGCLAVLLLLVWPKSTLADFLRGGRSPQAFPVIAIALLALLSYIGGRSGLEDFAPEDFAGPADLAALRPVPVRTVVAGKFLFAVLHTAFLLCLGLPFLTASLTVSGFGLPALGRACLLVGFPALAVRAGAVFLRAAADIPPVPLNLALFTGVLALFLGNVLLAPAWSPILLLASDAGPAPRPTLIASLFYLVLVLCLIGASLLAMALRRHRAGA